MGVTFQRQRVNRKPRVVRVTLEKSVKSRLNYMLLYICTQCSHICVTYRVRTVYVKCCVILFVITMGLCRPSGVTSVILSLVLLYSYFGFYC